MTAIAALINHPVVALVGRVIALVLGAAALTYIVLQLWSFQQTQADRQRAAAVLFDELRDARAERDTLRDRLSELEWTVWGDLQPKVDDQAKKTAARRIVIPVWQNREREILDRLKALETWRMRHMSLEH